MNNDIDDLGIVEDLNETKQSSGASRLIIFALLASVLLGGLIYSQFFYNKKEEKKEAPKVERLPVKKKTFERPQTKVIPAKDLPMAPGQEVKKDEQPNNDDLIDKGTEGTVIKFSTPMRQKQAVTALTPSPANRSRPQSNNDYYQHPSNQYSQYNHGTSTAQVKNTIAKKDDVEIYRGGLYSKAGINRLDPSLYIPKGTLIECTLVNRIVSTLKGNTKCIVSKDIYSADGNILLVEKGSVVTGGYEGDSMQNGSERLYVIWDEIRTINNVVVNVESGASGNLGAAGMGGTVDNHWQYRFGAAALVSVLDIGSKLLALKNQSDTSVIMMNSSSNTQQMAMKTLETFINIKPTLYKNQGDVVRVYLNRDLDFSHVYKLR